MNVGSGSLLRVVKHDSAAQQTDLELTYGKLRARAQQISKPGGTFEVHTAAGIAGVVGTDLYVDYFNDIMNVIVFEGTVKVYNLSGACVIVKAGEMTSVRRGNEGPPVPPVPAPLALMTSAASDTDDGEAVAQAVPNPTTPRADNSRTKVGGGPVSAGSSKFVWYAVSVVAIVTAVAIHQALESPDRPQGLFVTILASSTKFISRNMTISRPQMFAGVIFRLYRRDHFDFHRRILPASAPPAPLCELAEHY